MKDKKFVLYDLNEKKGWILSSFKDEEDIGELLLSEAKFLNKYLQQFSGVRINEILGYAFKGRDKELHYGDLTEYF